MNHIISTSFIFTITLIFYLVVAAQGQSRQDTTIATRYLDEIKVIGYDANRQLLETSGGIGLITNERIKAYDESSLVTALNTLPGVMMEERAPGSYRITIRGSSLRSPFGVRNVKVYWNDIPFTEPSGSTAFNLLDVSNMESIEVIKGPAGSIYGAGTGGVVNIKSMKADPENQITAGATAGSFGFQRYTASVTNSTAKSDLSFKYAHQESDGYRDQSFFNRDMVELTGRFPISDRQEFSASMLYTDLYYGIPGGLTLEQVEADPTQARPGNNFALGSIEANASVKQKLFLTGFTHQYDWNEHWGNLTTIYGSFSFFENPFNADYKRDSRQNGGGRTRFYYDTHIGNVRSKFTVGAEFQTAVNVARNFENNYGVAGPLNFDDELRSWQSILFAKTELDLPNDFYVTAGVSLNNLEYDIYRLTDVALDSTYRVVKDFDPVVVPRIGISKKFSGNLAVHGSISYGFSPPAIEDVRTNEGSINLGLKPEKGVNYEVGFRGNTLDHKINFDLTAFYFKLDETIVQRQSERGTVLFTNTGSTNQSGLEATATWFAIEAPQQWVSRLEVQTSYTLHHFVFKNYQQEENDYSGNKLTGVAPNISVTSIMLYTRPGLYANATYNFTDKIPLNDANTVYADPYHLVMLKIGYQIPLPGKMGMEVFAGINNLLNQKYSLGNDLNAFGSRYYQPAPERNYFAGLRLSYQHKN